MQESKDIFYLIHSYISTALNEVVANVYRALVLFLKLFSV